MQTPMPADFSGLASKLYFSDAGQKLFNWLARKHPGFINKQFTTMAPIQLAEIRCPTLIVHRTYDNLLLYQAVFASNQIAGSQCLWVMKGHASALGFTQMLHALRRLSSSF